MQVSCLPRYVAYCRIMSHYVAFFHAAKGDKCFQCIPLHFSWFPVCRMRCPRKRGAHKLSRHADSLRLEPFIFWGVHGCPMWDIVRLRETLSGCGSEGKRFTCSDMIIHVYPSYFGHAHAASVFSCPTMSYHVLPATLHCAGTCDDVGWHVVCRPRAPMHNLAAAQAIPRWDSV